MSNFNWKVSVPRNNDNRWRSNLNYIFHYNSDDYYDLGYDFIELDVAPEGRLDEETYSLLTSAYTVIALRNIFNQPAHYSMEELIKWDNDFQNLLFIKRVLWHLYAELEENEFADYSEEFIYEILEDIRNSNNTSKSSSLHDSVYNVLHNHLNDISDFRIVDMLHDIEEAISYGASMRKVFSLKIELLEEVVAVYPQINRLYCVTNIQLIHNRLVSRFDTIPMPTTIESFNSITDEISARQEMLNSYLNRYELSMTGDLTYHYECSQADIRLSPLVKALKKYPDFNRYYEASGTGCYALFEHSSGTYCTLSGVTENTKSKDVAKIVFPAKYVSMNDDVRYFDGRGNYITWRQSQDYDRANSLRAHGMMFSCCERKLLTSCNYSTTDFGAIYVKFSPCYMCTIAERRGNISFIPLLIKKSQADKHQKEDREYVDNVLNNLHP